jgi:hypothetical protein
MVGHGSEVCREALTEVSRNFKSLLRLNKMDPQVAQTVMDKSGGILATYGLR